MLAARLTLGGRSPFGHPDDPDCKTAPGRRDPVREAANPDRRKAKRPARRHKASPHGCESSFAESSFRRRVGSANPEILS